MEDGVVEFDSFYIRQSIRSSRIGLIVGMLLFSAFGIWDYFVMPGALRLAWTIRFCITMPVLMLSTVLLFSSFYERVYYVALVFSTLTLAYGMMVFNYYTGRIDCYGFIVTIFAINCMMHLKGRIALTATLLVLLGYALLAIVQEELNSNSTKLISNAFFLVTSAAIGVYSAYSTELTAKRIYRQQRLLEEDGKVLKRAKAELETSNVFKRRLLSIVSHDIKGPLANITNLLLLSKGQLVSRVEFDELSTRLSAAVGNTMNLLESLLAWSVANEKHDSGAIPSVNIRQAVDETLLLLEESARAKNNKLLNEIDPSVNLLVNPVALKLIIRNLVSNAIKFCDKGQITINNSFCSPDLVAITVQDNGIGMTTQVASQLFKWDTKVSTGGTRNETGTGIGLLICKECAEGMGGGLDFTSYIGVGTSFRLTLPAKLVHQVSCLTGGADGIESTILFSENAEKYPKRAAS